jgi:hypothetical protein
MKSIAILTLFVISGYANADLSTLLKKKNPFKSLLMSRHKINLNRNMVKNNKLLNSKSTELFKWRMAKLFNTSESNIQNILNKNSKAIVKQNEIVPPKSRVASVNKIDTHKETKRESSPASTSVPVKSSIFSKESGFRILNRPKY